MIGETPEDQATKSSGTRAQAKGGDSAAHSTRLGSPPVAGSDHNPYGTYALAGAQLDPEAAYWIHGPKALPRPVSIHSVLLLTADPQNQALFVPPYPKSREYLDWEIAELAYLQSLRDDPKVLTGVFPLAAPQSALPADYMDTARRPLSRWIRSGPGIYTTGDLDAGADVQAGEGSSEVSTGGSLARLIDHATPGFFHRLALNALFAHRPTYSPPRQARVWMAVDVAIYCALAAAWHYKWAANPVSYAYRQRPVEYDRGRNFDVLFDTDAGGARDQDSNRNTANASPGTPRAPSYPSGYSASAAAAGTVIAYFFPEESEEMERLANNIGVARLWAGVNWRSDHAAGLRVGKAVARRLIEQIESDCVPAVDDPAYSLPDSPVPDPSDLRQRAAKRRRSSPCSDPSDVDG